MNADQIIAPVLNRNLIFVHGKGGVGKTSVSKAIAAETNSELKILQGGHMSWLENTEEMLKFGF